MESTLLQNLVEEDFGYKKEGQNWGRSLDHNSLVVNEETQRWYWNSEDMGGDVEAYLRFVRGLNKKSAKEIINLRGRIISGGVLEKKEDGDILPYDKLIDVFWELGKGNREYWYNRKLTDKTIDRYRLGFYDGWNLIPLYDEMGNFANFQCRRDEPSKFIKYWYKALKVYPFNFEMLQLVDYVFVTEGMVDAILLNQEGIPAVSQTGGAGYWNTEWFYSFNRIKTIYYVADNDKAGRFAAQRAAKNLGTERVKIFLFGDTFPDKYDSVDWFRENKDASSFRSMVQEGSRYLYQIGELNGGNRTKKQKIHRVLSAYNR